LLGIVNGIVANIMGLGRQKLRMALMVVAGLGLAACDTVTATSPLPKARPPGLARPAPAPKTPSAESRELSAYFKRIEQGLLVQGLLRRDGGGPDVPFTARMLADNFERIALYEEYATYGGRLIAQQTASRLHRWEGPVNMAVEFGETVPAAQRAKDRASVANFAARLGRVSGHPVRLGGAANFTVLILNEDERRAVAPRLRQLLPGIGGAALDSAINMDRNTYCAVFAVDPADDGNYKRAVAIIRAEHPDLLRLSCIHEELAQGLGLSNDSPSARPSIFNDDEEFGLLTTHDEMLLRILYDPRLRAGMQPAEARTIARDIATELMGGDS
jgi:hypothetical protein